MEALYLDDCYATEFEAKVLSAHQNEKTPTNQFIVLDRTLFYPNSGGQPWDEGTLTRISDGKTFKVVFVGKFGGNISHETEASDLKEGDVVKGAIDWKRRHTFMRYHTAAHIFSAVIQKATGAKITGNQLKLEEARIDFSLDHFDRDQIAEYEKQTNAIIQKCLPVRFYIMKREDVEADPHLVKLAKGLPEGINELRIVDIEGFDRQPCAGTHVKDTKEIGAIRFHKMENKGTNNRRIYFTLI